MISISIFFFIKDYICFSSLNIVIISSKKVYNRKDEELKCKKALFYQKVSHMNY